MKKRPWYRRYAANRQPDEIITANNEGSPYLHRWHLIPKNKLLNIYLHHFVGPDQRVMHDHPWISLAYMLEGVFLEVYRKKPDAWVDTRLIEAGKWTYRSSVFQHFLRPEQVFPCWTIFITGPKIRKWGFITKDGWKHWKDVVFNFSEKERRDY